MKPPRRGQSPRTSPSGPFGRLRRRIPTAAIVGVAFVALSAAVVMWWLWPERATRQDTASTVKLSLIKEVKPAAAPKPVVEEVEAKPQPQIDPDEADRERQYKTLLSWRKKRHAIITNDYSRADFSNRVARTGTEQVLLNVFSKELGDMPMPMPNLSERQLSKLVEVLISKNEIKESDTEQVAMDKETLQLAKKEMQKYIREGGDPQEFLNYYHRQLVNAYFTRKEAEKMLKKMVTDGEDLKFIKTVRDKFNQRFDEDGIKHVEIPGDDTDDDPTETTQE